MKRTLSVLMIMAMLFATVLAVIPASAAGEAYVDAAAISVTTAEQFASMEAGKAYKLDADITISAAYGAPADVNGKASSFNGKFDGNGHTITLSGANAAFALVSGAAVGNLTVAGTVTTKLDGNYGGVAQESNNGAEFINCTSSVAITREENDTADTLIHKKSSAVVNIGGIVGYASSSTNFVNCKNSGALTVSDLGCQGASSQQARVGGIVGKIGAKDSVFTYLFEGCVNSGALTSMQAQSGVGGIIGQIYNGNITIAKCTNEATGVVSVAQIYRAGSNNGTGGAGIVGFTDFENEGRDNITQSLRIYGCVNKADIVTTGTPSTEKVIDPDTATEIAAFGDLSDIQIGGILGRVYRPNVLDIVNCTNEGYVSSKMAGAEENYTSWSGSGGIIGALATAGTNNSSKTPVISIISCTNKSEVEGVNAGGVVGSASQYYTEEGAMFVVDNCVNEAKIKGDRSAAGLLGIVLRSNWNATPDGLTQENYFASIIISNFENKEGADITAGDFAAGVIAKIDSICEKFPVMIVGAVNRANITSEKADVTTPNEAEGISVTVVGDRSASGILGSAPATGAKPERVEAEQGPVAYAIMTSVNYGTVTSASVLNPAVQIAPAGLTVEGLDTCASGDKAACDAIAATLSIGKIPDLTPILLAIAKIDEHLSSNDYSNWMSLKEPYFAAEDVLMEYTTATADQINAATTALTTAMDALVLADSDLATLDAELANANGRDSSQYTKAAWNRFQLELAEITGARGSARTYTQVEALRIQLYEATAELIEVGLRSALKDAGTVPTGGFAVPVVAKPEQVFYRPGEEPEVDPDQGTSDTSNTNVTTPTAGATQAPTAGATQAPTAGATQAPTAGATQAPTGAITQAPTGATTPLFTTGSPTVPTTPTTPTVATPATSEKKGGCGSAIAATAVVITAVAALGAGIAVKKKED